MLFFDLTSPLYELPLSAETGCSLILDFFRLGVFDFHRANLENSCNLVNPEQDFRLDRQNNVYLRCSYCWALVMRK